jgi:hypothetical protein
MYHEHEYKGKNIYIFILIFQYSLITVCSLFWLNQIHLYCFGCGNNLYSIITVPVVLISYKFFLNISPSLLCISLFPLLFSWSFFHVFIFVINCQIFMMPFMLWFVIICCHRYSILSSIFYYNFFCYMFVLSFLKLMLPRYILCYFFIL